MKKVHARAVTKKSVITDSKLKSATATSKTTTNRSSEEAASAILEKRPRRTSGQGELSSAQLRELEGKLRALQAELKNQFQERQSRVINPSFQSESLMKGDDAEVAEKQRVSNAALQELDILKSRLGLVQRALSKIRAGAYGFCEETDEPIGYDRLSVVPWARFAVHVQELRERKMREFHSNRLRAEA